MFNLQYDPKWPFPAQVYYNSVYLFTVHPVETHMSDLSLDAMLKNRGATSAQYRLLTAMVNSANRGMGLADEEEMMIDAEYINFLAGEIA